MHVLSVNKDAHLVDFGQLGVRDRFLATALLSTTNPQLVLKDILFHAHAESFHVDFSLPQLPTQIPTNSLSTLPSSEEHVVTVFAPAAIPPPFLATLTAVLQEHRARILRINRLTDPIRPYMSLQFRIDIPDSDVVLPKLQRSLFELGRSQPTCDLSLQRANVMRNSRRIVVFDLSWTLVQCDAVNVLLQAANITIPQDGAAAYAKGTLSSADWIRRRVALLRGARADVVHRRALKHLKFTHGAAELCRGLRRLGCQLAVVSSGSFIVADAAKEALNMDVAFGNDFEVDTAGLFTGTVAEPVIDAERKAELVHMLAMQEKVGMEQVVVVGDGPVSAQMLECAGLSIAFDQPEDAGAAQSGHISSKSLTSVLYLLGVTPHDLRSTAKA